MTPKELSVWDVMNGVSEEDAKQYDNIVFAKPLRIVTMPWSNTSVNANGTAFVPAEDFVTSLSELNRSLRDFNTAVRDVPLIWEEPWADEVTAVAQPH